MKMCEAFWNLQEVTGKRRREKSDDYQFEKVRYICKYPDFTLYLY